MTATILLIHDATTDETRRIPVPIPRPQMIRALSSLIESPEFLDQLGLSIYVRIEAARVVVFFYDDATEATLADWNRASESEVAS